jgi:alkyl hydroperoxide reductase subunit F
MQNDVTFVLQTGDHPKRVELLEFLQRLCTVSDRLSLEECDLGDRLRGPLSFALEAEGVDSGVRFSGIPAGHEFNSLILAILHASGTEMKLDAGIQRAVKNIDANLRFETVISLSCHNCPDVVQVLNQFALLNPHISAEMLDGGLHPDVVEEREIQGVPTVYLNGELFASGKVEAADLVSKLMEYYPADAGETERSDLPQQDVAIIGAGPAGISAAVYCARKGLKTTLVAERFGGQVKDTMGIENLISVPHTTGADVVKGMFQHLSDYEVTLKEHARVDEIRSSQSGHTIILSAGEHLDTRAVIVASGAQWRELGVPGEKENVGKGVAYCPHCDGPFFKQRDVAVIGGGNSGIEAAIDLAGIVKSVKVFEYLPELQADRVLVEQAQSRDNIEILTNVATQEIIADAGKVNALRYEDRATGEQHVTSLAGVFVQIGLIPNSQFVAQMLSLNQSGEILIDEKCRTSVPGIFACGDVTAVPYKQIVLAMGEGSKAAIAAFEYLISEATTESEQAA